MSVSKRATEEWRARVRAEYRSSALAAQALHWGIQVGLPDDLLRTAIRIVGDELDHAILSHQMVVALGADDAPEVLDASALAEPPTPDGPLPALLDSVVRNFCLGETFAVPLFAAMREGTTHPGARPALERILRDEAVHRQFGWDALDAILALAPPDLVRARIGEKLPGWMLGFRQSYGTAHPDVPLTSDERAAGLMPIAQYVAVWERTVEEDLRPRFARRGVSLPG